MGMFTTLFAKRKCERCGAEYLEGYQFKTGSDTCEKFKDGDLVPHSYPIKITYEACYSPICRTCTRYISMFRKHLGKAIEEAVLRSGFEFRQKELETYVYKGEKQIARYYSDGHYNKLSCDEKRSKEFQELEKKVKEVCDRQIKASHLEPWISVNTGWGSFMWNEKAYSLEIHGGRIERDARVHLGKRFRVEVLKKKKK